MPGFLPYAREFDAPPSDWHRRLRAACCRVAGVDAVEDVSNVADAWASRRATTRQVHRIAEAAGLHAHETTLSRRWWRRTQRPLVGILKDSGLPVAVRWRGGRFVFTDRTDGTEVPVTEETAARLEPVGYHLHDLRLSDLSVGHLWAFLWPRIRRDAGVLGGLAVVAAFLVVGSIGGLGVLVANPSDFGVQVLAMLTGLAVVGAGSGLAYAARHRALTVCQTLYAALDTAGATQVIRLPLSFFRQHDGSALATRRARWREGSRRLGAVGLRGAGWLVLAGVCGGALLWGGGIAAVGTALLGGSVLGSIEALRRTDAFAERRRTAERADALDDRMSAQARLRLSGATASAAQDWLGTAGAANWFAGAAPVRVRLGSGLVPLVGALMLGSAVVAVGGMGEPAWMLVLGLWGAVFGVAAVGMGRAVGEGRHVGVHLRAAQPFFDATPVEAPLVLGSSPDARAVLLDGVTVRPAPEVPPVLDDVTWSVPAGAFVVVRGATGAGTTTLLRTLLGLEPRAAGEVRHGEVALSEATAPTLRAQTTYLRQDGGIGGDVARAVLGERLRETTAGAAWRALEQAGLKETVEALPMQLQTFVSASTFSGGQRQRMRLAHAFAQNTPLLLLDAPFGAIDAGPMQTILSSLEALAATRIVVTRRDDVASRADAVYELREGHLCRR